MILPAFKTLEPLKEIAEVAHELQLKAYAVGGVVRDYLLTGTFPKEIDISVIGPIEPLMQALKKRWGLKHMQFYRRFGTGMLQWKKWKLEFVTARKESYESHSRKPKVEPATLEEDLARRDFTINALAVSLNKEDFGTLIDLFHGIQHLHQRLIVTPLDPHQTFNDDPLRMLRAIRFATKLHFTIEPRTYEAIKEQKHRIQIVSQERITEELNKILMCDKPSIGFRLLFHTGLLDYILPELRALQGVEEREGKRHKDNFFHTLEVLDNVAQSYDPEKYPPEKELWLRWAALLHDIGKAKTKAFDPEKKEWTFYGHEAVGAKMIKPLFRRLRLPLDEKMRMVKNLVALHQRPIALAQEGVTDSAIRRIIVGTGEDLPLLLRLCRADITTKNPKKRARYLENFNKLEKRIYEVIEKDRLRNWKPPITGEDIMQAFNIPPGPLVGKIKKRVREAILDGEIPNEREAALEYMYKVGKELLSEQKTNYHAQTTSH